MIEMIAMQIRPTSRKRKCANTIVTEYRISKQPSAILA